MSRAYFISKPYIHITQQPKMHTSQITFTTYMILSVMGLAMCAPIHDPFPYDPSINTVEWINIDEEVTCLNYQDCMEVFGIDTKSMYSEPLPAIKPANKCTVTCYNQGNSH